MSTAATVHIDLNVNDINMVKTIKSLLKNLRGVDSVKVSSQKTQIDVTKTNAFKEAMEDIAKGRIYHAENVEDMFQQILCENV